MVIQDQIKELFESLGSEEQNLILRDLYAVNMKSNIPIGLSPVDTCPYCSSELLAKNGHRGDRQRYKCK